MAPDTPRPDADRLHKELAEPGALDPKARAIALAVVGISWAWAIFTIGQFMVSMLTTPAGEKQPSVADFTKHYGPWVIMATVLVPLIVAAVINWLRARKRYVLAKDDTYHSPGRNVLNGRRLPAKCSLDLRAGDLLEIRTPGGGGWGAPGP